MALKEVEMKELFVRSEGSDTAANASSHPIIFLVQEEWNDRTSCTHSTLAHLFSVW